MTDIPNLVSTFKTHLSTACAAQTPAIVQVIDGEPTAVPNAPAVCYWVTELSIWNANTFSEAQYKLGLHWEVLFPGTQRTSTVNLATELRVAQVAFDILGELYSDVTAGGYATGVGSEFTDPVFGWTTIGTTLCRSVGGEGVYYLSNIAPILP